jgi:chlorophyll synthase
MMIVPQIAVVALLMLWGQTINAALVAAGILAQMGLMRRLLADPRGRAPWYNATGTSLYVLGMLATGFGLGNMAGSTG